MFTVNYKLATQFFWRSFKAKGDAADNISHGSHLLFILPDESHLLIPKEGTAFKFSKDRHYMILKKMEEQSGQKIPLKAD